MQLPFATRNVKQHGSALRRGVGGDRKAPDSRPQARNPPAAKIATKALVLISPKVCIDWFGTDGCWVDFANYRRCTYGN